jgi:D-beta-D-heptose 7-phosphate kinase/D-beta-D-heptose 1-phosphate adenosyltransferase
VRDIASDLLDLQAASVFVAGDALLDVYVSGDVERISPEAPVPVVRQGTERAVLGGAANVAANVAALGARAWLGARVGQDQEGQVLRRLCHERGIVPAALVHDADVPTTRKTRVLAGYQQLVRLDRELVSPLGAGAARALLAAFAAWLADPETAGGGRALVLADYAKGVLTAEVVANLLGRAAEAGVPVVGDPKDPYLRRFAGATVLKPNRDEARRAAAAAGTPTDDPVALADVVLASSGARNVVLSLSAEGVIARGADLPGTVRAPTRALEVADVSGAGDTMVAVLAMGCAAGWPLERSVDVANVAAGEVCGKLGTAVLAPSELLAAFKAHSEARAPEKWLADREIVARVGAQLRADGRRIVFANGCFDVLHAGHVQLLQAARGFGDVLVVGLNTDDSVRRLKGPARPVSGLEDRVAVLSALAAVDAVCAFGEDTPLELILALRPDVLVKGGDYAPEDVVGGAEAAAWGGRVEIVPLLDGRSTSRLLAQGAAART